MHVHVYMYGILKSSSFSPIRKFHFLINNNERSSIAQHYSALHYIVNYYKPVESVAAEPTEFTFFLRFFNFQKSSFFPLPFFPHLRLGIFHLTDLHTFIYLRPK
jgi:hypothetical protein